MSTAQSRSLSALSALLSFPDALLCASSPQLLQVLRDETIVGVELLRGCEALVHWMQTEPQDAIEARYEWLFGVTASAASRSRGAVHNAAATPGKSLLWQNSVHVITAHGDLDDGCAHHDYLPCQLELAANQSSAQAAAMLDRMKPQLTALRARLSNRSAGYASVVQAILTLAESTTTPRLGAARLIPRV